jgi:hypothetical protein
MDREFNHAANDSPRSGSSKRITPLAWGVILIGIVVIVIWFTIKP